MDPSQVKFTDNDNHNTLSTMSIRNAIQARLCIVRGEEEECFNQIVAAILLHECMDIFLFSSG